MVLHDGVGQFRPVSLNRGPRFTHLDFDSSGPRHIEFEDSLGDEAAIVYSGWQRNSQLSSAIFTFAPSKGTGVEDDVKPAL